jgi:glucose-1-phosphate adenylyltransferase
MTDVLTAILGGGQGSRLWPLTQFRAKPAVPLGGKFRLIDIPVSNSLHAGFDRIHVLTQFNSASLNRHISQTYRFDFFHGGFVNILAAEQTMENTNWYQGTADAVRQNLSRLDEPGVRDVLILSGDQLYLMDLRAFVKRHRDAKADITIAVTPVPRRQARGLGIMRVDDGGRIVEFVEKPKEEAVLDRMTPNAADMGRLGFDVPEGSLLASMGIYCFRKEVLVDLLTNSSVTDFGGGIIPDAIHSRAVHAFDYGGYWRDIGTIPAFLDATMDLTRPLPPLNLYSPDRPLYTHPRFLPGTKVNRCQVEQSIFCEGSILSESRITNTVVGVRAVVRERSVVENSYIMGARMYEHEGQALPNGETIPLGVGKDCVLRNCIVDVNARIGDGARLLNEAGVQEADGPCWHIRGGVIVIPRGARVPPGTVV